MRNFFMTFTQKNSESTPVFQKVLPKFTKSCSGLNYSESIVVIMVMMFFMLFVLLILFVFGRLVVMMTAVKVGVIVIFDTPVAMHASTSAQ